MNKGQKTLNIIFRVCVFATFLSALISGVLFMNFSLRVANSSISTYSMIYSGASEEVSLVIQSSIWQFIAIGLSVVCFVFSIICVKFTSAVTSVFRTVFMGIMALLNLLSISAVVTAYQVMKYINGDVSLYSTIYNNSMINNDTFEDKYLLAIVCLYVMIGVFFIFSITSIVSLVSKPKPTNSGYQQQMPNYGQPTQSQYGQPIQPQYGQPTQPQYGQPVQPQYGQPTQPQNGQQPAQPKIVGYNPNTGEPIYDNNQKA